MTIIRLLQNIRGEQLSREEIRELLFGRTITAFNPKYEWHFWVKWSKDKKKIEWRSYTGLSDSGKGWLEGDLLCDQWERFRSRLPACSRIYRNPDGTPEKKNEYLILGKDTILPFSPIN